jgi:ATP-dependent helicase/nuclease subunit A
LTTAQQSLFAAPAARPQRRNLVIEAGAGTGKTTAIVAEVLRLMLGDEGLAPERIVLVTFTEKAAGEIADRIHDALADVAAQLAGDAARVVWPAGSATPLFEVPSAQRDAYARACATQLARIDSLRSQTIHSFCQSLLRQFPIEAGLDPQFKIVEGFERSLLYGEAYDAWIDRETRTAAEPEHLAQWELLLAHAGYLFLIRNLILDLVERRDLLLDDTYDFAGIGEFEELVLPALEAVRFADHPIAEHARRRGLPARGSSVDAWIAWLAPIATDLREIDLRRWSKPHHEALKILRSGDKGDSIYDRLVSHRAAIALHALARRFVIFLDEEKRQRGVVDFDDLLLRTAALLDNHAGVLERIRQQLDYIFVDEFQDTDRTQARIIDRLARDRSGAYVDGRTVLVGDPKQSIYAFRRADPETYDQLTRQLIAAGAEHRRITAQYRSDAPLVRAINALFAALFPPSDGDRNVFRPPYHALRAAKETASRELDARITLIGSEHDDKSDRHFAEGEAIASWIRSRRDGGERDLQRFAILFRRLTKLDDYLDALERHDIDYVLPPTRLFLDRRAPVDLIAVLRAIAYPFDRGAEISAARTPYFALHDEEIVRNADEYASFLTSLAAYREASRHLTVSQLVEHIIGATNIEAVYDAAADGERSKRHLEHLRAITFEYDQKLGGSVRQFVDEIDRRRADPDEMEPSLADESRNAVRILTVHAAKGLEFETVILPDLDFPLKSAEFFTVEEPRALVMRGQMETLSARYRRTPDALPLKEIGKLREEAETRRLFYVAVTRAQVDVAFVCNTGPKRTEGFSRCLADALGVAPAASMWPVISGRNVVEMELGGDRIPIAFERVAPIGSGERRRRRLKDAAREAELAGAEIVPLALQPPPPVVEAGAAGDLAGARARARSRAAGILLHRLLERWDGTTPPEPLLQKLANEQGAEADVLSRVRQRLGTIAQSNVYRRIAAAETIGRELEITFTDDAGKIVERRIDRLIREPEQDVVIDYKTGVANAKRRDEDRKQVEAYCRAVARMNGRPCTGIVWYVDEDVQVDC